MSTTVTFFQRQAKVVLEWPDRMRLPVEGDHIQVGTPGSDEEPEISGRCCVIDWVVERHGGHGFSYEMEIEVRDE
jgi:hypothetical protein